MEKKTLITTSRNEKLIAVINNDGIITEFIVKGTTPSEIVAYCILQEILAYSSTARNMFHMILCLLDYVPLRQEWPNNPSEV